MKWTRDSWRSYNIKQPIYENLGEFKKTKDELSNK